MVFRVLLVLALVALAAAQRAGLAAEGRNELFRSAAPEASSWPKLLVARARRSAERCERRRLCVLHAGAAHSLLAAYQLYFVNREQARLWDHASRSRADCMRRFRCDDS